LNSLILLLVIKSLIFKNLFDWYWIGSGYHHYKKLENMEKDYCAYSVDDFLADEYFLNWVLEPNQELNDFWKAWIVKNPDKEKIIKEAKMMTLVIKESFVPNKLSNEEIDKVWKHIIQELF
jgi:hypothetical protein